MFFSNGLYKNSRCKRGVTYKEIFINYLLPLMTGSCRAQLVNERQPRPMQVHCQWLTQPLHPKRGAPGPLLSGWSRRFTLFYGGSEFCLPPAALVRMATAWIQLATRLHRQPVDLIGRPKVESVRSGGEGGKVRNRRSAAGG